MRQKTVYSLSIPIFFITIFFIRSPKNRHFSDMINGSPSSDYKLIWDLVKQRSTIIDRFDFIFWSGDFNYRVNQSRDNTIRFLKENKMSVKSAFLLKMRVIIFSGGAKAGSIEHRDAV